MNKAEVFNSIMKSKRSFSDFSLDSNQSETESCLQRIEAILTKYGKSIKNLRIWTSLNYGIPPKCKGKPLSENQLFTWLKLTPNVETISLEKINIKKIRRRSEEDLNLLQLKKIESLHTSYDSSVFFDSIPRDVVKTLVLNDIKPESLKNFWERQKNLKELELFNVADFSIVALANEHAQLELLKFNTDGNILSVVKNQPTLRYLDLMKIEITDDVFAIICNMKDLQVFYGRICSVSIRNFKSLRKLAELKELKLIDDGDNPTRFYELSNMESFHQLKKTTLVYTNFELPEEVFIKFHQNFKSLRIFLIRSASLKVVPMVLKHLKHLDKAVFNFSVLNYDNSLPNMDGLAHENLKELIIVRGCQIFKPLLKLVNACPNLRKIAMTNVKDFTNEDLKEMLDCHRHLNHFSLLFDTFCPDSTTIEIITPHLENLECLRFANFKSVSYCDYESVMVKSKPLFERYFSKINFYRRGYLVMTKPKVLL